MSPKRATYALAAFASAPRSPCWTRKRSASVATRCETFGRARTSSQALVATASCGDQAGEDGASFGRAGGAEPVELAPRPVELTEPGEQETRRGVARTRQRVEQLLGNVDASGTDFEQRKLELDVRGRASLATDLRETNARSVVVTEPDEAEARIVLGVLAPRIVVTERALREDQRVFEESRSEVDARELLGGCAVRLRSLEVRLHPELDFVRPEGDALERDDREQRDDGERSGPARAQLAEEPIERGRDRQRKSRGGKIEKAIGREREQRDRNDVENGQQARRSTVRDRLRFRFRDATESERAPRRAPRPRYPPRARRHSSRRPVR